MTEILKAPFPWFGGKSRVASLVWELLGDVDNYVEPFAGSLAVLLGRPEDHRMACETVNDADRYLSNFWRAVKYAPGQVAEHADWPVVEADLFARHLWLVNEGLEQLKEGLSQDPEWYDARIAGWWVWGLSLWIGSGWCEGKGPHKKLPHLSNAGQGVHRKLPHLSDAGQGVHRKLPHLSDAGRGVHRQLPHLGNAGRGVHRPSSSLVEYFEALMERLRRVRVCTGDWTRVVTRGALTYGKTVGVFLDPPYGDVRLPGLYATDSLSIAADVAQWCREHEDDDRLRIILCGYDGEHDMPGWEAIAWKGSAGYARGTAKKNRGSERLWVSPSITRARHQVAENLLL